MGFSKAIKNEVLARSARHCCVCRRIAGLKIQVHHIQPEAQGGPNTIDNAIALCLDCHADAGHYNPGHPMGTKFSPEELKMHRDRWFKTVENGGLDPIESETLLHCQYLICEHYEVIKEISSGVFRRMPLRHPFLIQNDVLRYLRGVLQDHRSNSLAGQEYDSVEQFRTINPMTPVTQEPTFSNSRYFCSRRLPTHDDLKKFVTPHDLISRRLLDSGIPPDQICAIFTEAAGCGEESWFDEFCLRPLWFVILAAKNITRRHLKLDTLSAVHTGSENDDFREFVSDEAGDAVTSSLVQPLLPPGQTMVLPLAVLLGPIEDTGSVILTERSVEINKYQMQSFSRIDMAGNISNIRLIGPSIWPQNIGLVDQGKAFTQPVHSFDLKRTYMIDRHFIGASCPHVFIENRKSHEIKYLGEIFDQAPGTTQVPTAVAPDYESVLTIAELEDEITHLDSVDVDGLSVISNRSLGKGESVSVGLNGHETIVIIGHYNPIKNPPILKNSRRDKRTLINRYINGHRFRSDTTSDKSHTRQ